MAFGELSLHAEISILTLGLLSFLLGDGLAFYDLSDLSRGFGLAFHLGSLKLHKMRSLLGINRASLRFLLRNTRERERERVRVRWGDRRTDRQKNRVRERERERASLFLLAHERCIDSNKFIKNQALFRPIKPSSTFCAVGFAVFITGKCR
jgi:hypothetical protein